jgi:chromosome segregation ATPase
LEEEKILLERALGAAKEQSQTLRDEKMAVEKQLQEAEEKAAMQIVEMEQKIKTLEQSVGDLQSQAKECWCITEGYERTFAQYSAGLNEAILLLQSLSASTMFPTGGRSLPFEKMDHGQIAPVACVPSQNIEY